MTEFLQYLEPKSSLFMNAITYKFLGLGETYKGWKILKDKNYVK